MRTATWGLVITTGCVLLVAGVLWPAAADESLPSPPLPVAKDGLIALSTDTSGGPQQVVVIDPQARVMSVYHIDRGTGAISLKSVRNLHWDLLMEEFNGESPSPRDIRSLLEKR